MANYDEILQFLVYLAVFSIGKIILRRRDGRLWAEMQGNIEGLLPVDNQVGNGGAGSPADDPASRFLIA